MGRFPRVILHRVRSLSNSVRQLSESVGTLVSDRIMPSSFSGLSTLCCWAKEGRRDPEIVIAEVLTMTPEENIDKEELEAQFSELVDELDLSATNRHAMLMLPLEKKWQIYCSRKQDHPVLSYSAEYYVDRVRAFIPQESPKLFESLKTSLRTEPHSFVQRYLELDGLEVLLRHLQDPYLAHSHSQIIGCLKALLNNSTGRAHVLAHPLALNVIAESLAGENLKAKVDALEILGATCLVPGGHRKAMGAISSLQEFTGERTRFQTIITDLDRSTGPYREDIGLKTAIMSFINAILSYGPGSECTEFRLHLRYELLMLGIVPVIGKLRTLENVTLDKHLDFFEMMRNEDERELARRLDTIHVDTTDVNGMFDMIKGRWCHSLAFPCLQSILVHLLVIPGEMHWILLDRVLQQIVLHPNVDRRVLALDIDDVVKRLGSESELISLETKLDSTKSENDTLLKRLCDLETEFELSIRERERLENQLYQMAQEVERAQHQQHQYNISSGGSSTLSSTITSPVSNGIKSNGFLPSPTPPIPSSFQNFRVPAVPSGTVNGFIPPPPPPLPSLGSTGHKKPKKPVPSASAPLKSFNWSKIPDSKVEGTVWTQIVEAYDDLDLVEMDRLFSAYQKQNGDGSGMGNFGTIEKCGKRTLSVIDSRRAQNCTILLSKLKMSDEEICGAIVSMDARDEIPGDMVEQLLKFTPTLEERSLLEENQAEELARADHFLLKISRISHYEERLFTLYYKKRFQLVTSDLQIKMKSVIRASEEVKGSRKLRKLLQLILSVGNYMNRGQRGNASGFRLNSLTRLADTKSNSKINLLNYIVGQIEQNHRELLDIEAEIGSVRGAAKVSLQEVEKEMTGLRLGLTQINVEVEFQKTQPVMGGDRFLSVTREFLATGSGKVEALEKLFSEMKWKFSQTVKHFGEETSQIDEFFAIFDSFLSSFTEARLENEGMRRRKEDEEKKQTTLRRAPKSNNHHSSTQSVASGAGGDRLGVNNENKGEFDDLISALRTGDVFSDLNDRGKRSRSKKARDFDSRERIH